MRAALLVLVKDLRTAVRNRSLLVLGFLAPLGLAFVFNLVFGGLGDPDAPVTFDVGVADLDGGDVAAGFTDLLADLAADGLLDLRELDDEATAREAVEDGDLAAAWVVPAGFSESVRSGRPVELLVVADVDSPTTAGFARHLAERYSAGVATSSLAAQVAVATGVVEPAAAGTVAEDVAGSGTLATLEVEEADTGSLPPLTALTAGITLFFVFFTAGLPTVSIIEERTQGTLARLLVAPVPSWSITAGKVLAAVVLGVLSLASLMGATTLLMGVEWGPPLGALLLATAAVVAAAGIMTIPGGLARTTEQAGNVQAVVAVAFALLGGVFVPLSGPQGGALATLELLTPHGWFHEGLRAQLHGSVTDALPAIGVLLAMGVATGAVGLSIARRSLRR